MGRRSRKRAAGEPALEAPEETYATGEQALTLRCVLTAKTRRQYAGLAGSAAATAEDLWQRRVEFLFERLAVRWTVNDVPTEGQKELLRRYRAATPEERRWIRETLRTHLREWFPDVEAP